MRYPPAAVASALTAHVPARTGAFDAYRTTSLLSAWAVAANAKLSKIANEYGMNLGKCVIFLGAPIRDWLDAATRFPPRRQSVHFLWFRCSYGIVCNYSCRRSRSRKV